MILPEDVKVPMTDDHGEDIHDQYWIHDQHSLPPYSPLRTSHDLYLPLLHASQEDLELGGGLAVPSAAQDPNPDFPRRLFRSSKKTSKSTRYRWAACWICVGIALTIVFLLIADMRRPRHRRGNPWSDAYVSNDLDPQWDGEPVKCTKFDSGDWSSFPISPAQPHLPSPIEGEGERFSKNTTFLLSTQNHEDLFTRLAGNAGIGDFFVNILEPPGLSANDGHAVTGENVQRDGSGEGESVTITVEPIITLQPDEEEIEQSLGWRMLQASDICLMKRHGPDHAFERHVQPHSPVQRGVGIYTHRLDDEPRHDEYTPLRFRIHVALPAGLYPSADAGRGFFDSLTGPPLNIPKGFIRSLSIDGAVGGIWISNITSAAISELKAELEVGEIELDAVRAEDVRLKVQTGAVKGHTFVSRSLDAEVPS